MHGTVQHSHRVLQVRSGNVPDTIRDVAIRDHAGIHFEWTEGNPVVNMFRFLISGTGEVAPVPREVLSRAKTRRVRRPDVRVT